MTNSVEKRAARKAAAKEFHNNLPPGRSALLRLQGRILTPKNFLHKLGW